MTEQTLYLLPPGYSAKITELTAEGSMRRRLLDMGLTAGTGVTCLFESPSGGIRAYSVRGAVIALRTKDAETIKIKEARHVLV